MIDEKDWCQPIIEYLEHGKLPKDSHPETKVYKEELCTSFIIKEPYIVVLLKGALPSMSEKGRVDKNSKESACRCLWSTLIETKASTPTKKNELLLV